jgi:choline dehydrogenase
VAALRVQRAIFEARPIERLCVREIAPGTDVQDDDAWLAFARATGDSAHHLCGTCKMGTDRDAVVDAGLRVRGIAGLSVVDASIMPTIVSGNTQAATIAIAEKGADLIARAERDVHASVHVSTASNQVTA